MSEPSPELVFVFERRSCEEPRVVVRDSFYGSEWGLGGRCTTASLRRGFFFVPPEIAYLLFLRRCLIPEALWYKRTPHPPEDLLVSFPASSDLRRRNLILFRSFSICR